MTKAEHARIVAWRLRILRHAEGEPRQVATEIESFNQRIVEANANNEIPFNCRIHRFREYFSVAYET